MIKDQSACTNLYYRNDLDFVILSVITCMIINMCCAAGWNQCCPAGPGAALRPGTCAKLRDGTGATGTRGGSAQQAGAVGPMRRVRHIGLRIFQRSWLLQALHRARRGVVQ